MSKTNGAKNTVTEFQFYAPKEKQTFGQFFYNDKDGTYFGRTPKSWGQLLLFYAIFYIVLAALFTICMQGLFSSLTDNEPTWKLDRSLIGTNPGLGFRPISEETERGSVIQFDTKKPDEGKYWIDLLNDFLKNYDRVGSKNSKFCSFNQTHSPQDVCDVDVSQFGPCSPKNEFGYRNSSPCVFLKLNKIFNWKPDYFDNPNELPISMPESLKKYIAERKETERQLIWVSCNGTNAKDQEDFSPVKYYPAQGFPAYFYPYRNQDGYVSPLVAVQFEKLKFKSFVNVECRAWAKNIIYNGSNRDRMGSVSFQLFVD